MLKMNIVLSVHITLLAFFTLFSNASNTCGRSWVSSAISGRVMGGSVATKFSWPWIVMIIPTTRRMTVSLLSSKSLKCDCSGVILNSEWILTAAHCMTASRPGVSQRWSVLAGVQNRDEISSGLRWWQDRSVKRVLRHPRFKASRSQTMNDIALLQLEKPLVFSLAVQPVCLPGGRAPVAGATKCITAGWGATEERDQSLGVVLSEVQVPIVSDYACMKSYPGRVNRGQHLCGGDWHNGKKDSCKGDSGGPLMCQREDGSWYVAGIVSWGEGCGRKRKPGVYVKVKSYEMWMMWYMHIYSRWSNGHLRQLVTLNTNKRRSSRTNAKR